MEIIGNIFLHLALVIAVYSVLASLIGGKTNRPQLVFSSRNAVWAVSALVLGASALLIGCLVTGKFYVEYVHQYSNSTMPLVYKVAAFWGGQDGSLLFWLLILCAYSSIVMFQNLRKNREFLPYIISTLMTIATFFLIILVFTANPFDTLPFDIRDGRGLNPLLQNYYMIIHPPSLYLGYVGMSVPFAFAIAAMISGRLDNHWILQIRKWTITAWFFLSLGNLLGASWAYEVLGWGGYWGWDPVENAAFIPWLTATAFLHSVIIQEKRGMLKTWNMVLVVLSFLMTMTGTFLTRSGIISSVHSFAQSDIGYYFLGFLIFSIVVSVALLIYRLPELKSKNTLDSFLSRESSFLFNNLVLVGAAFAILWGTLFPVMSEWVRGSKITVGPPYFNSLMVPIGLLLLLLTGIGPLVAWRKNTPEQLKKNFIWPVLVTIVASLITVIFTRKFWPIVSFSFCAFVMATIFIEYQKGIMVRMKTLGEDMMTAFLRLIANNKRRYGGYVVHVGIVLLFIGFTGEAFKIEKELQVKVGETATVGDYQIRFDSLTSTADAHAETVFANVTVSKNGEPWTTMQPARIFYRSQIQGEPPQPNTLVDIHRSLREDLYLALLTFNPNEETAFIKMVVNPLVQFIWIGGLFLMLGTIIVMWPGMSWNASQRSFAKAASFFVIFIAATVTTSLTLPKQAHAALTEPEISKQLKCICGCNFPDLASCACDDWAQSAKTEIRARIKRGEDEQTILKYFTEKYGETVLTVPVQKGFNRTAWLIPGLALLMGLGVVGIVIRKWGAKQTPIEPVNIDQKEASTSGDLSETEKEKYKKMIDTELYGDE